MKLTVDIHQKTLPKPETLSDEWFILKFLEAWTAQDIRYAIMRDVDLAELMDEYSSKAGFVTGIISKYPDEKDEATADQILWWFSVRRPDLYKVIVETEFGVNWIIKNMKKLKPKL